MKALLKFSFRRRLLNPISLTLHILFVLILAIAIYFDVVSSWLNLNAHQPYQIVANTSFKEKIHSFDLWKQQGFEFVRTDGEIEIVHSESGYRVKAPQDPLLQRKIYDLILINHKQNILTQSDDAIYDWLDRYENIHIEFDNHQDNTTAIKHHLIFVLLTSMYFMMLNFIAVNSNEIILEKISNVIPLFLSSISLFQHYLIKLILGLSTVLIQLFSSFGMLSLCLYLRYRYDQFSGLLQLASKYLPIPAEFMHIKDVLIWLQFSMRDVTTSLLALAYMILGIFTIQVFILVLSSKVKTMEEAASIQGPFYLLLLMLYYLALGLNQQDHINSLLARVLSYMPITSMMVMPIRLLSQSVFTHEIVLSFMFATLFCVFSLGLFYPLYQKGILDEN